MSTPRAPRPCLKAQANIGRAEQPILDRVSSSNDSMVKRTTDPDDGPPQKRHKITRTLATATDTQEIQSSRDLRLLLAFEQDVGPMVRQSKNHRDPSSAGRGQRKA